MMNIVAVLVLFLVSFVALWTSGLWLDNSALNPSLMALLLLLILLSAFLPLKTLILCGALLITLFLLVACFQSVRQLNLNSKGIIMDNFIDEFPVGHGRFEEIDPRKKTIPLDSHVPETFEQMVERLISKRLGETKDENLYDNDDDDDFDVDDDDGFDYSSDDISDEAPSEILEHLPDASDKPAPSVEGGEERSEGGSDKMT